MNKEINIYYNDTLYSTITDVKSVWKKVRECYSTFWDRKVYYVRQNFCEDKCTIIIDFGSHTNFVKICFPDLQTMKDYMGLK